jgi:hypothetical protein
MSWWIPPKISMFDEIRFPKELMIGAVILIITGFVAIKIINFDLVVVEVGDVVVSMWHSGFHTHVIVWLKTRTQFDGWQWNFI